MNSPMSVAVFFHSAWIFCDDVPERMRLFQLRCLVSYGDWNHYARNDERNGVGKWNGFCLLVITLLSLCLHGKLFRMGAALRWIKLHALFHIPTTGYQLGWELYVAPDFMSMRVLLASPQPCHQAEELIVDICNREQVMISRPRSDLHINLPALRKLDAMLLVNQPHVFGFSSAWVTRKY